MHGESYHIRVTGTGHQADNRRPFYVSVDGVPEEILVETLEEIGLADSGEVLPAKTKGSKRPQAKEPGHVTTSMPGTIVDVLVKVGDEVKEGDALLVTEAMKMETEIQAPISGKVTAVHIQKGDTVNPDETLIEIK